MKSPIKAGVALFLACLISAGNAMAVTVVPELSEKMTQGQFAQWLVAAIGASSKLPAAATEQDAIDFLKLKLNVQPKDGWDRNVVITKQFLASLLGDDAAASLNFNDLIQRVRDYTFGLFDEANLGTFRAFSSSASGSVTI